MLLSARLAITEASVERPNSMMLSSRAARGPLLAALAALAGCTFSVQGNLAAGTSGGGGTPAQNLSAPLSAEPAPVPAPVPAPAVPVPAPVVASAPVPEAAPDPAPAPAPEPAPAPPAPSVAPAPVPPGRSVLCSIEAGPLWSNVQAQSDCHGVCQRAGALRFTGQWWTTRWNEMSVCQCAFPLRTKCPKVDDRPYESR